MNKQDIINFLYYLLDKIDIIYYKEVEKSIERFTTKLDQYFK